MRGGRPGSPSRGATRWLRTGRATGAPWMRAGGRRRDTGRSGCCLRGTAARPCGRRSAWRCGARGWWGLGLVRASTLYLGRHRVGSRVRGVGLAGRIGPDRPGPDTSAWIEPVARLLRAPCTSHAHSSSDSCVYPKLPSPLCTGRRPLDRALARAGLTRRSGRAEKARPRVVARAPCGAAAGGSAAERRGSVGLLGADGRYSCGVGAA